MDKVLEKYFIDTYPKIFRDMYGPMETTCMHWGIATGAGWFRLLNTLCFRIQEHINWESTRLKKSGLIPVPQLVADQIKEKFGSLRFYYQGGDEYCNGLVQMAEDMSFHICENCGTSGDDVGRTDKGWIQTLCKRCAKEYGKVITHNEMIQNLLDEAKKQRKNPNRSWPAFDMPHENK